MHSRIEQGQPRFSMGTAASCSLFQIAQRICSRVCAFVKSLMGSRDVSSAETLTSSLRGRVQPPKRLFPEKLVDEILGYTGEGAQRKEELQRSLRTVNPLLVSICFNVAGHCFDQAKLTNPLCEAKKEAWSTIGRAFVFCCADDSCGFSAQVEGQQRTVTYDEVLSSVLRGDGQFMPSCGSKRYPEIKRFIILAILAVDLARDTKRERPLFRRCEDRGFHATC